MVTHVVFLAVTELLSWRNIEMSACFLLINKEEACRVSGVKRGMTNHVHI